MLPIHAPCHPEPSEGSLTSADQRSLATLGMTTVRDSRAPREGSRGIAFDAAGPALYANPREDAFFELPSTGRLLNGRVSRRLFTGEDRGGGKAGGGDQHDRREAP